MPASMDSPSPKRLRSDPEAESADKDRISCLPEDIIGFILSLLTSREAQATCLLSRRWRHLSTCRVTNLDFDRSDLFTEMKDNCKFAEKEKARYVEWVDNVLQCQSGGYHLRRFMLRFDLTISYKSHIDRWIRFALTKRVKVLQLDFRPASFKDLRSDCDPSHLPYPLGHETLMDADAGCLQRASGLSNFGLNPSSSWHVGLRYLEELTLYRVTVEGELIKQLLANCPILERLILVFARTLNRLRVSGQSLKLKYLLIGCCDDLERVKIYDTDLVSFTFEGVKTRLRLYKLPQLSEVSITGCLWELVDVMRSRLSRLPCLHILNLKFFYSPNENLPIRQLPKLTSVKQLKLTVDGSADASLLPLAVMIKACPYLQSFVLETFSSRTSDLSYCECHCP
ncbi:hypothetical protein EUGRSUZ_A01847 [Eucalyptus grandis]|uniref:Uncharacterized protein n=2 Tax=Eucalyptus grandis TaxID=71139 RepID=A0ACC3M5S4_EUCGR|nr:hypothetical protein EUGRSUZ_A01847 [Eucalyptus grandis]